MHSWVSRNRHILVIIICLVLAFATAVVYLQVRTFSFVSFDDPMYVRDNPIVRHGITPEGVKWAFTAVYASNWHPLTWLSHMADVQLFGMRPGMHHLVNVVFHILNVILLFLMLARMTGAVWRSAAVAALFALHPLHVESVAWISERKDVLSTFFWLLTMLCYHWYVRKRGLSRYLMVVAVFCLGLMAKSMLVTLPFVLLLLDFWPLRREGLIDAGSGSTWLRPIDPSCVRILVVEKIPLLMLSLAASGGTFYAQSAGGAVSSLEKLSLATRLQNAIISYPVYLLKTLWPLDLAVFYPYPRHFSALAVAASLLTVLLISLAAFRYMKKLPYLFTGWFWFLGTLVPVIGIIQVGSQSMADRYTYVPLIGIFILCAWGLPDLLGRVKNSQKLLAGAFAAVIVVLAWASYVQTSTWKNSESLFNHALLVTRDNYLAHNSLGVALYEKGDVDGAIGHYRESIRINQNYLNSHCNLGVALAGRKQYAEAFSHYRVCLKIKPGYSEAHYNMGVALSDLGRKDEAVKQYESVLKNYPHHENALNNLGLLLAEQNRLDEAVLHYELALAANPDNIRVRINLAEALLKKGRPDEAISQVEHAISIDPGNPELHVKRAELYLKMSFPGKALAEYRKALSYDPSSADAIYGLGVLLAGQGELEEALSLIMRLSITRPKDPLVDYNLACLYSRKGKTDEAIKSLMAAAAKGFKDWKTLIADPDLDNVRKTAAFRKAFGAKIGSSL